MELTSKGKRLGRAFRKQAERYLYSFQNILVEMTTLDHRKLYFDTEYRHEQTYQELNHQANMAILSLLAAILAYIDPEYKHEQISEPLSRSDD